VFTDQFCKVTINLHHRYKAANTAIIEFFKVGDRMQLFVAVSDLISAKGKDDEVTFDPLFNDEAKDLPKLRMVDLPDIDLNVSSWVNVMLSESVCLQKS